MPQDLKVTELGEETVLAFMIRTVNYVQNHNMRLVKKGRHQKAAYEKQADELRVRIKELEAQVDETVKL